MTSLQRSLACSAFAGLIGALWWAAYTPSALPLGWILGAHLIAGLVLERALWLLRPRWRSIAPPLIAIALAAGIAPIVLAPIHRAGLVGGKSAALVDLAVMALAALLGVLWGELAARGRRGAAVGGLALTLLSGVGVWRYAEAKVPTDGPPPGAIAAAIPDAPVAILGVDGADWQVMEPMMARGELPNLAALRARGRHGVLRSLMPMASPVVWTSIFTGQPPSVHGLSDWDRSDDRSRRVPTLWDIYGAAGRSTLTINVPGSWPPHDVPKGRLISGFPLPGLSSGDKGHLMGQVVDSAGEGPLRTLRPRRDGAAWTFSAQLADADIAPRVPWISHAVLDAARREGLIPVPGHSLSLRVSPEDEGAHVEGDFEGGGFHLDSGAWSGWLQVRDGAWTAWLRLALVRADAEGLVLFISPPFQDPRAPKLAFATGELDDTIRMPGGAPYVVEGLGWTAHRDPRVAALVPEMILDVQRTQTEALLAALGQGVPTLTAWVFTATDRLQHPFWSLLQPAEYPAYSAPASVMGLTPVEDAYREADAAIGRVLALLPAETTVFVVSDHGADPADAHHEHGEAGHRDAGAWIAAGPHIPADAAPVELSVLDITPTVLRCVGGPLAAELPGRAYAALCPGVPEGPRIERWGSGELAPTDGSKVSDEQMEQIRALGYVE